MSGDVRWLGITYSDYIKNKDKVMDHINKEVKWKDEVEIIEIDDKLENEGTEPVPEKQNNYNLRPQGTQSEEKENIPREIRNLDTSYNDATNFYKSLNDGDTFLAFGNTELYREYLRMDSELAFFVVNEMAEPTTFDKAWNHRSKILERNGEKQYVKNSRI